jgi:SAM-dependent methyltransferase
MNNPITSPLNHPPANLDRFTGLAGCYEEHRPSPPAVIADILTQLACSPRPALVVDLGSGTGFSTLLWAQRAEAVVGIEPNPDMRRRAEALAAARPDASSVRYYPGVSSDTGLSDGCADIVTCAQSLHWMEPESTLAEVARILRPGGIFAAYDYDRIPTIAWEVDRALDEFLDGAKAMEDEKGSQVVSWPKAQHLRRIRGSGHFRYIRDFCAHHMETGNAERLIGYAMSMGSVDWLLKQGLSEADIGLDALRDAAYRILGSQPRPWYFTYRARVGVK